MADQTIPYKIYLTEEEMPKAWYNLRSDMKNKPAPLLNPGTGKPLTAEELSPIFCEELVAQELDDTTPFIEIPEEIRNFYKMYRPCTCLLPREEARYSGEDLLQVRRKQHQRKPQAQLRYRSGLLCQEAGPQGRYHRDRCRSVGNSSFHGLLILRS